MKKILITICLGVLTPFLFASADTATPTTTPIIMGEWDKTYSTTTYTYATGTTNILNTHTETKYPVLLLYLIFKIIIGFIIIKIIINLNRK